MSIIPRTTRGFSVKTSSRPTKSPIVLDSPRKVAVAAVVIVDRIVEPGRDLDVPLRRRNLHRVGVVGIGRACAKLAALPSLRREARIDRRAVDAAAPLVGIVGDAAIGAVVLALALGEMDDIGRVVHDDVHVELHAARDARRRRAP